MTAKEITEAILYLNPNTYKLFRAAHILNDSDRNWKPKEHNEYPFISAFKNPKFLVIINLQIHVYIIGDVVNTDINKKFKSYHIIDIEGFSANHMTRKKSELTDMIKSYIKEKKFMPDQFYDRIIYMKPGSKPYVYNRINVKGDMFSSKAQWTFGVNIYDASRKPLQYQDGKYITANDILKNIYEEF